MEMYPLSAASLSADAQGSFLGQETGLKRKQIGEGRELKSRLTS